MKTIQLNDAQIFNVARKIPPGEGRNCYLEQACGVDTEVRKRVDVLLDAYQPEDRFLEGQAIALDLTRVETRPQDFEENHEWIGPYKLLEVIGEGGMGTVYMAEQTEPVKRRVALKLIKTGMDTRQVIARFEAERQALALMDHPNIAKVHDAGATDAGRPYFVMELVKGKPITEFCDELRLDIEARLKLFQKVCQAVQHAHQKGIIHRDLKPSNVMVAMYDDQSVPKVIDFGVAKATGDELTEQTMFTRFGQIVGTLEYMSPEQAQFNNLDIDTRSDIYSLGAIFYELLAGEPPFEREKIKSQALDETLRMIREDEPTKPSTRLSAVQKAKQTAANRLTSPEKLGSKLRGDLDWIVMKALEKDRTRRYQTASVLTDDIDRYLNYQPVLAMPPKLTYRLRKFIGRNKTAVSLAILVISALCIGLIVSINFNQAIREQKNIAEAKTTIAKQEAENATAIARFMVDDFLALTTVEGQFRFDDQSSIQLGRDSTLRQLLLRAGEKLNGQKELNPKTESQLHWIVGSSLMEFAHYNDSIQHLRRALSTCVQRPDHDPTERVKISNSLTLSYVESGLYLDALKLADETYQFARRATGIQPNQLVDSLRLLAKANEKVGNYPEAVSLFEQALDQREALNGIKNRETIASLNDLAHCMYLASEFNQALEQQSAAVALAVEHLDAFDPVSLRSIRNLADIHGQLGDVDRAVELLDTAITQLRDTLGDDHSQTVATANSLATCLTKSGRIEDAKEILERNLEWCNRKLGIEHPNTITCLNNLGTAYAQNKEYDLAEKAFRDALSSSESRLGNTHPQTLNARQNLAAVFNMQRKWESAIPMFEQVLASQQESLGEDHIKTLTTLHNLGYAYFYLGRLKDARDALEAAQKMKIDRIGANNPSTLRTTRLLSSVYCRLGKNDRSLALARNVVDIISADRSDDDPDVMQIHYWLATQYWACGEYDNAIMLLQRLKTQQTAKASREHPKTVKYIANLGKNLADAKRFEEAIEYLEEAHSSIQNNPELVWVTPVLIGAYLQTGREQSASEMADEHLLTLRRGYPKDSVSLALEMRQLCENYFIPAQKYEIANSLLEVYSGVLAEKRDGYWVTYKAQSLLGDTLVAMRKFDEAERILLKSHDGLLATASTQDPVHRNRFLSSSFERLVRLYEAKHLKDPQAGHDKLAAEWRERWAEFKQHD